MISLALLKLSKLFAQFFKDLSTFPTNQNFWGEFAPPSPTPLIGIEAIFPQ